MILLSFNRLSQMFINMDGKALLALPRYWNSSRTRMRRCSLFSLDAITWKISSHRLTRTIQIIILYSQKRKQVAGKYGRHFCALFSMSFHVNRQEILEQLVIHAELFIAEELLLRSM